MHMVASTGPSNETLLVLDIPTMEFSMVDHPPCARFSGDDVAIVEAGQGTTLMFVPKQDTCRRVYTVWRNNGGSSIQWQMEKTISLDSDSFIRGAVGRHLLVYHIGRSYVRQGSYMRDVDTSQLERVCGSCRHPLEAYCNFPPSLLSSPTVSSGTRHADAQGAGEPELRESDPGGVLGPVIAAAAQAPNPLLVVEGRRHGDIQGAGDDVMVSELREADPEGVQGPVVAAAARALNPLLVIEETTKTTPSKKTLCRRAAAAPPLHPWNIFTFRNFRNRRRRSTNTGTGSERTATPPSCERGEGGGSVVAPQRAPPPERITAATKTPDRPRHPLHDAAGRPLLNPRLTTDRNRGFPTLPPPQRPAEGGETGDTPSASWIEQGGEKIASSLL